MTLAQALADAHAQRRELVDALTHVDEEIAALERVVNRSKGGRPFVVLDLKVPDHGLVASGTEDQGRIWRGLQLTRAVERVLEEAADDGLTRHGVFEALREHGRLHDDLPTISATLSYLKRVGRAHHDESLGVWCRPWT